MKNRRQKSLPLGHQHTAVAASLADSRTPAIGINSDTAGLTIRCELVAPIVMVVMCEDVRNGFFEKNIIL